MVEPATLDERVERRVTLTASRLDMLLLDWLGELILLKDRDGEVFPTVEVTVEGTGPFTLRARLEGGTIRSGHTSLRSSARSWRCFTGSICRERSSFSDRSGTSRVREEQ
jgi:SHS2 domain-containing protein